MVKVGTEKFSNGAVAIDINVDARGMFCAEFNDQEYREDTRAKLIAILTRVIKAAAQQGTVEVTVLGLVAREGKYDRDEGPFTSGDGVVHARLRGKHERQHNCWLLISDDGKKFQVSGGYSSASWLRDGQITRRLTPDEVAEYLRLKSASTAARKAHEAFIEAVQINPADAWKAAQS